MAFNGLGTFSLIYNWITDRNNGIKILASRMMAQEQDIADALSLCITKDGQQTVTANIPMSNNKITLLASGTAVTDAANLGQVQASSAHFSSAGTVDAYTAGFDPPLTSLSTGMAFNIYFGTANTGNSTATFNPDGLGAGNLVGANGTPITLANTIKAGVGKIVRYGSVWYYTPPSSAGSPFGLPFGGVLAPGSTGGTADSNYSYLVDASSTAQFIMLSASPATGDAVPLTIFGTKNVKLWASGGNIYGDTATIETGGAEGLALPRYTGTSRGWVW